MCIRDSAEALLRYLKVTSGETPFLIREPDEIKLTLEQEEAFIRSKMEEPGELLLIGEIDGKQVGNCSVMSMGSFKRYAHRCEIAIALYQEYCCLLYTSTDGQEPDFSREPSMEVNTMKIQAIEGDGEVSGIRLGGEVEAEDTESGAFKEAEGVFVALGTAGSGELARQIGAGLTEKGNIQVNSDVYKRQVSTLARSRVTNYATIAYPVVLSLKDKIYSTI